MIVQSLQKRFSHDKNILLTLEKNAFLSHLHLRVPLGNLALISLDLPLISLIGIVGRRRKILTCTQKRYNKSKA
jgi:hypothetical protein